MNRAIATLLFVGLAPRAPGTVGSAVAALLGWVVFHWFGWAIFSAIWLALSLLGWWSIEAETRRTATHDASEIVIDELSGQWIAMLPALLWASQSLLALFAAFLLFRLFDITKVGPIGWADRQKSAFFVMFDDILAGIAAAIILGAILWII